MREETQTSRPPDGTFDSQLRCRELSSTGRPVHQLQLTAAIGSVVSSYLPNVNVVRCRTLMMLPSGLNFSVVPDAPAGVSQLQQYFQRCHTASATKAPVTSRRPSDSRHGRHRSVMSQQYSILPANFSTDLPLMPHFLLTNLSVRQWHCCLSNSPCSGINPWPTLTAFISSFLP